MRHLPTIPSVFILLATVFLLATAGPGSLFSQESESTPDSVEVEVELTDLMRAQQFLGTLQAGLDSLLNIENQMHKAEDEKLQLLRVQAGRHIAKIDDVQPNLMKILPNLDESAQETADIKKDLAGFLAGKYDIYERAAGLWSREIDILREKRSDTPPEELGDLETSIGDARDRLDRLLPALMKVLDDGDLLGMDTKKDWGRFDRVLNNRAENLVGRLQIAVNAREALKKKIATSEKAGATEAEIGPDRASLQYSETRVQGVAKSLETTVDLLKGRGFETAQYQQFIIKTTGEITDKVLDPKVFIGLAKDFLSDMGLWFKDNGPTILVKLLIILASVLVFRLTFRLGWWLMRLMGLIHLTKLMVQLGNSLISPIASFIGLFFGLWLVGADPTTLLAGAGVAGVVIGFALQDSLANLAAGFFILATRPFDVDDTIRTGTVIGTVKAMWIANTTVVTFDGRRLLIPNRMIWADIIENRSVEPLRRVDFTVRVGFDEDIDRVITVLHDLIKGEERLLDQPEAAVFVSEWADSWVEIAVRPWARNENWWPLLTDLPRQVVLRFAEEGIKIPYPRLEGVGGSDKQPPA
ncbi:MAG: mechanosensitive ion channel family protein [Candidatus Krumholzibacteria bacterium]|nr:mechanosensitive ion channel family protein [Candidatus Krumholzibacteria bacterium]